MKHLHLLLSLPLFLSGCLIGPVDASCNGVDSCDRCIELSGCGWCPSRGCMEGSSLGPAGTCDGAFLFESCDSLPPPCETASSCGECVARDCVWCTASSSCGDGRTCSIASERRTLEECTRVTPPPPIDRECSEIPDCRGCLEQAGCVFEEDHSDGTRRYCDLGACDYAGGDGVSWAGCVDWYEGPSCF